jgi:hypothetical protein
MDMGALIGHETKGTGIGGNGRGADNVERHDGMQAFFAIL